MKRLIPLLAVAALLLAGCEKSTSENTKDVTEAREKASQDTTEARKEAYKVESKAGQKVATAKQDYSKTTADAEQKLDKAEANAMTMTANSDYDVAMARVEGAHKVAVEKCDLLKDVEKTACKSTADAAFAASQAKATAIRDAALVQAERHK